MMIGGDFDIFKMKIEITNVKIVYYGNVINVRRRKVNIYDYVINT